MIHSACNPGDKILVPRNIHKSAMNALILCDLQPIYMQAGISEEFGFVTGVTFETVKKTIDENPDARAISKLTDLHDPTVRTLLMVKE